MHIPEKNIIQRLRNKELRGHKESSDLGADPIDPDSASGSDVTEQATQL
jgi:hypothetical protein